MNWADGKPYFFSGPRYVRYDIGEDLQDPNYLKDIAGNWTGVSPDWVGDGIDAAVNLGDGRAYLFKGDTYVGIDWASKSQLPGYPLWIADQWPGVAGPFDAAWTNAAPAPEQHGSASPTAADFVARFRGFAEQSQAATGVPMLVTLGQAALESNWGRAAERNNFFGIKAEASDSAETPPTLEDPRGPRPPGCHVPGDHLGHAAPGRKVGIHRATGSEPTPPPKEAFTAHGQFLRNNSRYAAAFEHQDDPYAFAQKIADAGYATDPGYFNAVSKRMRDIEASL